ncbi:conserved membrane hypothetical protein [uncultured delta proteobacterium]|uniref:Bile acid:sodium symporter n=1 Tax=uncultured delta proteobacterium TaxID=34034 RepID=A0A212IZN1_9DELT|nr:conserved membrane hypothetical protein [uncultured delta proteobacterium]
MFLTCTFSGMLLGVFVPFLAEPLAWFPRASMIAMLFMSFLAVDGREALQNLIHYPLAVFLLVLLKLFIMPVVCWGLFHLILPEYALGAALVGGAATAVVAPFFAFMVQADFILVMVGLVTTSLLVPFAMPLVFTFIGVLAGVQGGIQVDLPGKAMMLNLSVMMLAPFVSAQIIRRVQPALTGIILRRRQGLFFFGSSLTTMVIFAQYSSVILNTPHHVLMAFVCAGLAGAAVFAVATAATFWLPPPKQLAFVISCVAINNIVVLIIAVDFFSAPEALTTAIYAAPLFLSLPFYRLLGRLRGHNPQ